MGRAALATALGCAAALGPAAASPRFFASAGQCEEARILVPGSCRIAFANAMAEFAAKAPVYRSRLACMKQFGPCMPWPIGTRRFDAFRPQWVGAVVDTDTVAPVTAPGRIRLEFVPQSFAALSAGAATQSVVHEEPAVRIMTPDEHGGDDAAGPPPRAGEGFTVIDGVLTYPAPARFQPKNLKHP